MLALPLINMKPSSCLQVDPSHYLCCFTIVLFLLSLQYSSESEEGDLMEHVTALENKKKKELAAVDHSKVEYQPYRKNFYVEVPELARMTPESK